MKPNETIITSDALKLTIGKRVKALRARSGISAKECAARVGVSARAFSEIEHGRAEPRASTLLNIGVCFGVTLDYLCNMDK